GKTFLFKLSSPDSAWTVDLKNGKGAVTQGGTSADCTLEISDADFRAMVAGKADAMKLWTEKKLKIGGDIMASQKLMFLKKIDPKRAIEVVQNLRGAGGHATAATPAAQQSGEPTSAEAFAVIADYIQSQPQMAAEIGKTFLFRLTNPDSAWTIDLKNGKGAVTQGGTTGDCTLDISDEDFRAMVAGKADAMKLWTEKKLKIGGDIMASQKLMFLKKIDPKRAMEVVSKARGAGGAAPATATATATATGSTAAKTSHAPAIFKALGERLAKTPGLVKEVGAVVGFVVDGKAWTVDLKSGSGSVKESADKADITLKMGDADLALLAKGHALRDLYQRGQVRVDGDAHIAHKLTFLKGLV
ncbi:MAG TPA: SCP2 sterol-binding domain-containing protein, partial [Labilithrix sp.]